MATTNSDNSNTNPTTPANATAAKTEEVKGAQQNSAGTHADTRNDSSPQASSAGQSSPASASAGTAPNNAKDPQPGDPNSGDPTGGKVSTPGASQEADDKKADNATPASSAPSADDKKSDDKPKTDAEKKEAARKKEAAKDPNQSVSDPDFNPDTKDTNPDSPAGTPPVEPTKPLDGKAVKVSKSEAAGAPLGANTVDDTPKASKHADVIKKAKLRVKEINANLEKADPAAYRDAVQREVSNLTNGDPEAAQEITKHWNDQAQS